MELKKIKINLNHIDDVNKFIKVVRSFASDIDIIADRACLDAKSYLGVRSLDLSQNVFVRIISDDIEECEKFEMAMEEFR